MNIQEEIKALKERIAELEAQSEGGHWIPQDGDSYWYVDNDAEVMTKVWRSDVYEKGRTSIGNVFRTEGQAEFVAEKLIVEAELRKHSRPFKEDENNYFIQINSSHNNIVVDSDDCYQTQGTIYFESKFEAHDVIQTVGRERIKKYLFGVED